MRKITPSLILCIFLVLTLTRPVFSAAPDIPSQQVHQEDTATDAIEALVEDMEAAVLARDAELYLSYVDLSNANFAVEHTNWANEWANEDFLTAFALDVLDIEISDEVAIARLEMSWETSLPEQPGMTAVYPVEFHYDAESGSWRYGGEHWITRETDHFLVHAVPGLEESVEILLPELPSIYEGVTVSFDYEPQHLMEIKLYDSREALGATILLSLPLITGWNEPGESLKLIGTEPERFLVTVAHEFTHFLTFDQAGQAQSRIPWWLNEGIAQYLAQPFDARGDERYDETVFRVQEFMVNGEMAAWAEMADFPSTPVELWQYVYPQGYTFVRYVTETYGEAMRNEWLHAQAVQMDVYEATEAVLGLSFEELDQNFLAWLTAFGSE